MNSQVDLSVAWHLAQLKPNGARLAERNLRRQGYEVFNPKHEVTQRRGEKFVAREVQLFPGYIFVGLNAQLRRSQPINATLGVSRLVGFGHGAAVVPPALIAELARRCDAIGVLQPESDLVSGDQIRVIAGPFAEFVTTVERIDADQRVWVLLDLMGRAARVHLDPAMVEKV